MSPATIDGALREANAGAGLKRRRGPVNEIRSSVPVRTFSDGGDPTPGFCEADLVWHSGPSAKGSFVQTLVVTDIATGWTECMPLPMRERAQVTIVLSQVRKLLPFALLGFDTDNDSVFVHETLRDYCVAEHISFTRCWPYRRNDQGWVEQKNGSIVRRIVGYRRFEGLVAATALAELYATVRLSVNFFQPSFKLADEHRAGVRVHKRDHKPATPYQRRLTDPRTSDDVREKVKAIYATLDPARLLREMRNGQQRLIEIAAAPAPATEAGDVPTLDTLLDGLRNAWQNGEVRPKHLPLRQHDSELGFRAAQSLSKDVVLTAAVQSFESDRRQIMIYTCLGAQRRTRSTDLASGAPQCDVQNVQRHHRQCRKSSIQSRAICDTLRFKQ